jgi:hypothetical protein
MIAGAILILAAAGVATAEDACHIEERIARLGRGSCALEPRPDGMHARRCTEGSGTGNVVADDGTSLWMDGSDRGACDRPRGLVRYDRGRAAPHAFRGTDSGPCGFRIHDLLVRDETLWVATDLGVSRLRVAPDDGGLEETACGALLMEVAEAAREPGGEGLGGWLAEFRPRFVRRLPRGTRPASTAARRRDEQALGHAERSGTGRGADVHPRPVGRPQAAPEGGGHGGIDPAEVVGVRKGLP